ncbi:MAG: hypothetical protein JRI23_34240, partial [Deltaproteobacteria bacterium]|nr:hypothetical protein [Deltaproteobacteria bacterium]MBW2537358.1 hypothetical protein [Deltaproteobacteria bacterium]
KGGLDWRTHQALTNFERKNRIFAWGFFGKETLQALGRTPRERLYDAFRRVIAERIVDARGIIEDGTAVGPEGNKATYVDADGKTVEVPNLVAENVAAVLRHTDLTTPDKVVEFLRAHDDDQLDRLFVALSLPELPPYYAERMDLFSVIDRGDVWYDYPFVPNGDRKIQPRQHKPTLSLYAIHEGKEIELVRWPTTIGGWQPEAISGGPVKLMYKESLPGPHIWRDVVALPRWIPPASTPRRDLWRPKEHGRWAVKLDTFGPGYASAYGMVMMINHREETQPDGSTRLIDHGVRAHGSVSYASILDGFSHGCHRLHNHRAVRMAGFLLEHRNHQVRGPMELDYHRTFRWRGNQKTVHFDSRGYRYELTPPVPVDVLEGNIRGHAKTPRPPMPLTRPMWKRYSR